MSVILGNVGSGETIEANTKGSVSLSCFLLQENGGFTISSLVMGLLCLHHGPTPAFRISSVRTQRSGVNVSGFDGSYLRVNNTGWQATIFIT